MSIHSTAVIDPSAKIGKDVSIEPYAVVGPNVVIGDRTRLMSHCILKFAELGADCLVYPYASIGLEPQHLQYQGEPSKVTIGNRTVVRESVTVHRGTRFDTGITSIGDDCYLMAMSHVAHDCKVGNKVILANSAQLAGHVELHDNVFISTMVGVHQFVRIGKGAMVSGGSMVPLDIAPFCNAQGDRASIRGLNVVGMRRLGLKKEIIKKMKEAYKVMFSSGVPLKEALEDPALKANDEYVRTFRNFLSESKRGFLRPARHKNKSVEEEAAL